MTLRDALGVPESQPPWGSPNKAGSQAQAAQRRRSHPELWGRMLEAVSRVAEKASLTLGSRKGTGVRCICVLLERNLGTGLRFPKVGPLFCVAGHPGG